MRHRRLIAMIIMLGAAGVLAVAAWLEPAAAGHGTHQRLGLPPCGWIAAADVPCPTCGMTTAFAHAANGDLLASFLTQPLGALLALTTAMTAVLAGYTAATGARMHALLGRLWSRRAAWILGAVVVLAWLYKIADHRGLLENLL